MGRRTTLSKRDIAEKIVSTYPDSIEENAGDLNFDVTCDNFAERIMEEFDVGRQKFYFGREFMTITDCVKYIRNELPDILELCQAFIDDVSDDND